MHGTGIKIKKSELSRFGLGKVNLSYVTNHEDSQGGWNVGFPALL
jgi:hypothetical protein